MRSSWFPPRDSARGFSEFPGVIAGARAGVVAHERGGGARDEDEGPADYSTADSLFDAD